MNERITIEQLLAAMYGRAQSPKNFLVPKVPEPPKRSKEEELFLNPIYYEPMPESAGRVLWEDLLKDTAQRSLGSPVGPPLPWHQPQPTDSWWEYMGYYPVQSMQESTPQVPLGTPILPPEWFPPIPPGPSSWERMMNNTGQVPFGTPIDR